MARWEPNARERLALAALELFAERGYENTTVIDIAQRAGLTKSTFFRHFQDKREVLFGDGTMNGLLGLWNAGGMIVLSLYFQQVLHDSALATGLAIAPQGVVGFTAGAFGARLASRVGIRRVLVLTSAVAMVGFLVLTRLPASGGYSPLLAAVMVSPVSVRENRTTVPPLTVPSWTPGASVSLVSPSSGW